MSQQGPSEEELQAVFEEQMRRVHVQDVVLQTVVTLVNLAGRRLGLAAPGEEGAAERDLDQARLAIEATRALVPLLPADAGPIREALTQLQMAYAREAGGTGAAAGAPGERGAGAAPGGEPAPDAGIAGSGAAAAEPGSEPGQEPSERPPAEDPERARARARIWTPPGS